MARSVAMVTRGKQEPQLHHTIYLAGVLDADGSISISKMEPTQANTRVVNPRYVLYVNIVNTSKELMEWLVVNFGGRYKARRRQDTDKHRITYDWRFENGKSLWLLELVEPYLIIKRDRARVGIELLRNWVTVGGQGAKTPTEEVARRERLYQMMKDLNQFGPVQPQRLNPLAPAGSAG